MARIDERLANQRKKTELARLKLEEHQQARALRGAKTVEKILAKYDSIDSSQSQKRRRQSAVERKGEDNLHTHSERLKGSALGRDLHRNFAPFKGLLHQLATLTVGTGPKARFNTDDKDWNVTAADWLNGDWAKWCDGCDDSPLSEILSQIVQYAPREGDVLVVFDDFDRDDGTLRFYEQDQIVEIDQPQWERESQKPGFAWKEPDPADRRRRIPLKQSNGYVYDSRGRVVAYIVTTERGRPLCDFAKATILPVWHPRHNRNGVCKLYKRPFRLTQHRGQADALTIANQTRDIYEMIGAELQSAKKEAQQYAAIESDADSEGAILRALKRARPELSEAEVAQIMYGDGTDSGVGILGNQYEAIEGLTGGQLDYLNPGEKLHVPKHERPSASVRDFSDWILEANGFSMGIGRVHATGRAESSYTAFRGEQLMTWATIEALQKSLERRVLDFLVYKAVTWAVSRGELAAPPAGWWKQASWTWPSMPEVDRLKTANAARADLKNGIPPSKVLGPDWERNLAETARLVELVKAGKLPLSIMETVAGVVIEEQMQDGEPEDE